MKERSEHARTHTQTHCTSPSSSSVARLLLSLTIQPHQPITSACVNFQGGASLCSTVEGSDSVTSLPVVFLSSLTYFTHLSLSHTRKHTLHEWEGVVINLTVLLIFFTLSSNITTVCKRSVKRKYFQNLIALNLLFL